MKIQSTILKYDGVDYDGNWCNLDSDVTATKWIGNLNFSQFLYEKDNVLEDNHFDRFNSICRLVSAPPSFFIKF